MFSAVILVLCFATIVTKIESLTGPLNLSLILINETTTNCEFNVQSNPNLQDQVDLCLDEEYYYRCNNNKNVNNVSLQCHLVNSGDRCHNIYVGNNTTYNMSLGCYTEQLNNLGNNPLHPGANDCVFGIFTNLLNFTNGSQGLVCAFYTPLIQPTAYNATISNDTVFNATLFNGTFIQQSGKYYRIPFLGLKIKKHFARTYGIAILVGIALLLWCLGMCCFGMCYYCYTESQKSRKNNQNCRMPQSSRAYDV